MNESAASTTLKRIALFKVNKVPYLLEFNINWAAATHLTRVWSRWDELGKQAVGQTTVRKGRGNSTVSKSILCVFFFFSTYKIILGIHTYIFHNREWFFLNIFLGGDNPRMGGTTLRPPRDLRPCIINKRKGCRMAKFATVFQTLPLTRLMQNQSQFFSEGRVVQFQVDAFLVMLSTQNAGIVVLLLVCWCFSFRFPRFIRDLCARRCKH